MADGRGDFPGAPASSGRDAFADRLTRAQHRIARQGEREEPFSPGNFHDETRPGAYDCAACDAPLFHSDHKFDARTGWPTFYQPADEAAVGTKIDFRMVTPRTEVHCATCGSHMGHVFKDGPAPTGLRYSLNGSVLRFRPGG